MKSCESCEHVKSSDTGLWCSEGFDVYLYENDCPYFEEQKIKLSTVEMRLLHNIK